MISDRCSPNILPEIYTVAIHDKLILVVEFFRGNLLPYFIKSKGSQDGVYIRIGATNRQAEYQNILELQRQRQHISFDEEINFEVEFDTLNLDPITRQFNQQNKMLDHEKMFNLKLIKFENKKIYPTNTLLILLGLFENCAVKCASFKGVTMDIFTDKKEYKGDIFTLLEDANRFILNHIHLNAKIEGLYRKETFELPEIAIREALINAFIHRDYTNLGRDIKVGIYDDVLNIVSPGGFPNSITSTEVQNGRSEARNRIIANIFRVLGLIEQWGSGLFKIKQACHEFGLKEPIIKEAGDFVDVEIYRAEVALNEISATDYDRLRPIKIRNDRL